MRGRRDHFDEPVLQHARRDVSVLRSDLSAGEAIEVVRRRGVGERIVYFYVVDQGARLIGVLPVRRLLTAHPVQRLSELMVGRVVTVPESATVLEACELFAVHRFLALPVVDRERHVVGVVDVTLFTDEVFDVAERQEVEDIFEAVGFRVSELRRATPARAVALRFPWLLSTVAGGTACALVVGLFRATLAESLVLAFFLTLVLGLGESVAAQSMTLTIQALHAARPTFVWYAARLRHEAATGAVLGLGCGLLVASIASLWEAHAAVAIGSSIGMSLLAAGVIGLTVPSLLHALHLDLKVAAGPLTLALTDVLTVAVYFGASSVILG